VFTGRKRRYNWIMENTEAEKAEKKLYEDMKWLIQLFPKAPDVRMLESSIQSFALFMAINARTIKWDDHDLIKLTLAGYIATRARMVDENKFTSIDPLMYYQVAQYMVDRDYKGIPDTPENFKSFLDKVVIVK
jgi:hypothetical protein